MMLNYPASLLVPVCPDIAKRRRRLLSNEHPLAYLHNRVQAELMTRVRDAGGWGNEALYLGFRHPVPDIPASGCLHLSPLEGDDLSVLQPGFDQVVINLQLAWFEHQSWFDLVEYLLRPGGHVFFSSFGPDTLTELDQAWRTVDTLTHVHAFTDMHHMGDAMLRSGLGQIIVDAQWLKVDYEDVDLLMQDLRREGFHNVSPDRRKTLTGRKRLEALRNCFQSDSSVPITFELIYGYAERPQAKTVDVRVTPPTRHKDD